MNTDEFDVFYSGLSGGKDSTALALWMIHESGYDRAKLRFTFCDTGNEHQFTYDAIQSLSERFVAWGAPSIETIRGPLDFWQLAAKKKRFPSSQARFCTQELKTFVTQRDIRRLAVDENKRVLLHSGVRAAESAKRAALPDYTKFDLMFGCSTLRPLLRWSIQQVWEIHQRYGVPRNKLYDCGAVRVGCFPCIMSRKAELRLIADNFPERFDLIRQHEQETGYSFFSVDKIPLRFRSREVLTKKGERVMVPTIDDVARWSRTEKGAKFKSYYVNREFEFAEDRHVACDAGMGSCE